MSGISLSDDAFEAILGLAANAPCVPATREGPRRSPPLPVHEMRVAIWDERRGIKLTGKNAPTARQLPTFLAAHPHCSVYAGQDITSRSSPSASSPSSSKQSLLPPPKLVTGACSFSLCSKRARSNGEQDENEVEPPAQRTKKPSGKNAATTPAQPSGFIRQTEQAQHAAWANGGPVNVLLAMEAHPADPQLQADGCQALTFLASHTAEYKRRVCAAGGAIAIVRALETHGVVPMQTSNGPVIAWLNRETQARVEAAPKGAGTGTGAGTGVVHFFHSGKCP